MKNKINTTDLKNTETVERKRESYSLLSVEENCNLIKLNRLII